jgi:hypothetical protein
MTLLEPMLMATFAAGIGLAAGYLCGFGMGVVALIACPGALVWMVAMVVALGTGRQWVRSLGKIVLWIYPLTLYALAVRRYSADVHGPQWIWVPLKVAGFFLMGWLGLVMLAISFAYLLIAMLYCVRRLQGKKDLFD